MSQGKDPVLEKMRAVAFSKQIADDFPVLIAFLDTLDFGAGGRKTP